MIKKVSIFLIIAGILIAAFPLIGQLYTSYRQWMLIRNWENNTQSENIEQTGNAEESYNELQNIFISDTAKKIAASDGVTVTSPPLTGENTQTTAATPSTRVTPAPKKSAPPPKPQIVLGIMKISKIKVNVPIVEGVAAENLRVGVGHIPGTAQIGDAGNSAIAGHRSYTFGRFFNRLDEMVVGDKIEITTKKGVFTYIVYEKLVVKPTDLSVLKKNGDKKIITLITCTPIYVASHRLIIHAELDDGKSMK